MKAAPAFETLSISTAKQRFAEDASAGSLLAVIDAFFENPSLRVADPVLIVDATSRDPVPVVSGNTVHLTAVRVMTIAILAQQGVVRMADTPLYVTHREFDQALAAMVRDRPADVPEHLALLRHLMDGIPPDGFLPADQVALANTAACAENIALLADLILRHATSPDNPDYTLGMDNPAFVAALPECLKLSQ